MTIRITIDHLLTQRGMSVGEFADRIGIMPGTTICGLADGAGWPVKTAIRKFRPEFESYLKSGPRQGVRLQMAQSH